MAPAIEFRQVRFTRPGGLVVLHGVSFAVEPGEVVALVGRSGAGKTSVLKLINRLLLPERGVVLAEGRDTREWDPYELRQRLGYVIQEVGLLPHMTIEQNVGLVGQLMGWPRDRLRLRVHELLELVGLPAASFSTRWPDELSGGQRQRAGVARALCVDPPILLMDEPFGALDPVTRAEMRREFQRIQSLVRKTVILVTHDMSEAFALGQRIGVLDMGMLVAWGAPNEVARSPEPAVKILLDAAREASFKVPA